MAEMKKSAPRSPAQPGALTKVVDAAASAPRTRAHLSRPDQLNAEALTTGRIGDTADAREAMAAFLDECPPTFSA